MTSIRLLTITCLLLSGCGTPPSGKLGFVQRLLDDVVPADFRGNFDSSESVPAYANFTLAAGNLHRTPAGWSFDWLEYHRNGPFLTSAHLSLGNRPK